MVFLQHYRFQPWGWSGVDLFFVISGFLITGILFDTKNDVHRARNFYVRRTLRIFPLYYGIMALLVLTGFVFHWNLTLGWLVWPAYIGNFARFYCPYLQGSPFQWLADFQPHGSFGNFQFTLDLSHFWTLCVEEQFYLIWPWFVFFIRDRRKLMLICALTLPLCLFMRLMGNEFFPAWLLGKDVLFRFTPFRIDSLLLGGLLALWLRGSHAASLLRFARIAFPVAIAVLILLMCITQYGHIFTNPYNYPPSTATFGLSAIDITAALLLLVAIQPGSIVNCVLSLKPLAWMGRISYGAYVFHEIPHTLYYNIGSMLMPAHLNQGTAAVAFVFTIILAWLSYRYFESPFLKMKDRWTVGNG